MDTGLSKRLSHAYIIAARPDAGFERATLLAQEMLCGGAPPRPCGACRDCRKVRQGIHPDVLILARQTDDKGKPKREIYVDQIRELAAAAPVLPGEAERKVFIIRDAGSMNPAAQNALLKLLEEPPSFLSFILIAEGADQLLETVRSRCVLLQENGEEDPPPPEARERAERYLDFAAGRARLSLISFANEHGELSAAEILEFVKAARILLTDMLCRRLPDRRMPRSELMRISGLMDRAEEYLRFNVSVKHVLGLLTVETVQKGI